MMMNRRLLWLTLLFAILWRSVYSQPPYNGDPQGPRPFYLNELFEPAEQPRPPPQQMYYGNMFNNPEVRIHQQWNVPQPRFPQHYQQHVPSIEDHNSLPKVLNISDEVQNRTADLLGNDTNDVNSGVHSVVRGLFGSKKKGSTSGGLVVHFTFDQIKDKLVIDDSPKANNGKLVGQYAQTMDSPKCKMSIRFEGGQGHIELDGNKLNEEKKDAMSISLWVRVVDNQRENTIYGCAGDRGTHYLSIKPNAAPNAVVNWLYKKPDGKVVFHVMSEPAIPSGMWTHITAVYNAALGKVKMFVNGEKIVTTTKDIVKLSFVGWSTSVEIAKFSGNPLGFLDGSMDEFQIFTSALMHTEVQALMEKCEFPTDSTLYFVDVKTGPESFSGTPSRVFFKLIGEKGAHGEELLGEDFSRGSTRQFNVYSADVGRPVRISIRKDTKGIFSTDWYLEKVIVTVEDRTDGPSFIFNCNCWIGKDKNDLQKYLTPEKHVDGNWSPWSQWSGCGSGLCGGNKKVRTRSCTNPHPTGGGKACPGDSIEEGSCPIDGGWGAWGEWSACSKTCGGATVTRVRKCDNPAPSNGGKPCEAKDAQETKTDCNQPCEVGPLDGHWSDWSEWSPCAKSCGGSRVTRKRSCNNPSPQRGGEECPGEPTETAFDCETPCPVPGKWGDWEEWSVCSATCGTGNKVRTRECNNPAPQYGGECPGNGQETEACEIRKCPTNVVNGAWGPWGPWGECSEKEVCNKGVQLRTRQCNNPAPQNGGDVCPGTGSESQECPKTNCKETPQNTDATKPVEPNSFIALVCNSQNAELLSDSAKNPLVAAAFSNLPKLVPFLKGGYFAVKQNTKELNETCFEPMKLLTIAELAKLYPGFRSAKPIPFFTMPADTEHVTGIKVNLRADKALYGVEFLLDSSSVYAPTDTVSLENVMFLFRVSPGKEEIVAHGFDDIGKAKFAVYASLVGENEVTIEGTSGQTATSEEIQAALSPNTPVANDFSFTQVLRRGVRNLDSKSPTDQLAPLENVSKDGKYAEKAAKMSNEKQTRHNKFTHRSAVPSFSYEPINELREEMPITYPNAMTVNPLYAISPPLNMGATPNLKGLQDTPKRSLNLNIDQKILEILKRVNLGLVTISDLSLQISASMKEVIVRVSGKVAPNGIGGWFNFEIIRKDIFAVAFTTEQAAIEDFVQKMFNTKLGVFEKLEKTSFGISFAQKGYKVTPETKFQKEPLKSLMKKEVPDGLFFAAVTKFAANCGDNSHCKFGKILMGKDSWLKFHGGVSKAGVKVNAGVYGIPIKGDLKFNKVELFIEVKFGTAPVAPKVGFAVELDVPVEGEVSDKEEEMPSTSLQLGGKLFVTGAAEIGTTLYMNGMWKKAFGLSFLSIGNIQIGLTISLATGIPTEFTFNGRLEIGHDCQGKDDFKVDGPCFSGEALVGISANPAGQYIYGELSPVTIGKILRMLGSKLQLPPPVLESGFPKGLIISAAWKDQKVPYAGATKEIKKGVFIKGTINILGFAPSVEILLSNEQIKFDLELDPVKLLGNVQLVRSIAEKKKGPKFYVHAKRKPLQAEIYIQGAVVIFGNELEIMFKFTTERIESEVAVSLFNVFKARVAIAAGYGNPFANTGFTAKFTIETGFDQLSKKTSEILVAALQAARKALEKAQVTVKEAKLACERKAGSFCNICEKLACDEITEECKHAMDKFKHYVGEKIDKFGRKIKSIGEKFESTFKKEKTKRYMDLLTDGMNCAAKLKQSSDHTVEYSNHAHSETRCHASRYGNSTHYRSTRRKRFVGKMMCEKLAKKACTMAKDLCKGSCNVVGHITKGMCQALDLAVYGLHVLEQKAYWAEQAVVKAAKNMLVVHSLSFETHLTSSPLDSTVSLGADVSIFGSRGQFKLEFNLADPLKNVHKLADTALEFFKKLFSPRPSKDVYDKPAEESDFEFSGEFRIQMNGTKDCLSTPASAKVGSPVTLGSCDGDVSQWVFTLTGGLMNVKSGLCAAMGSDQGQALVLQQACDVTSEEQKFTCNGTKITPVKDSGLCVTGSAGKTGSGVVEAKLLKCDDKTVKDEQAWMIYDDPRALSVCDKHVPDIALGKPALQSSLMSVDELQSESKGKKVNIPGVGPELAVDGNMATEPSAGSCSITAIEVDPWWKVDLQSEHIVTDVNVVSSSGNFSSPLSNFEVRVGILKDHKQNPMCGDQVRQLAEGEVWTAECKVPIPGQYVSVSMVGKGYLAICEVAVFARLDDKGKCSSELSRKRDEITYFSPEDMITNWNRF
ncbi:unnamed protein product [Pocillopora meandrina]|uniref:PLAT domain-containing protein n=1 Tax=Pocillopora meandrina TaxID=46732 RepID=A0AAU9X4E3_9CNID|nr:unnamed protein product [Pocillopora meandrina]